MVKSQHSILFSKTPNPSFPSKIPKFRAFCTIKVVGTTQ